MRIDRSSDRPVRYLEWRVRLLGAGAILGIVGIGAGADWLVSAAIAVLLAAAVLGVVARRGGDGDEEGEDDDGDAVRDADALGGEGLRDDAGDEGAEGRARDSGDRGQVRNGLGGAERGFEAGDGEERTRG